MRQQWSSWDVSGNVQPSLVKLIFLSLHRPLSLTWEQCTDRTGSVQPSVSKCDLCSLAPCCAQATLVQSEVTDAPVAHQPIPKIDRHVDARTKKNLDFLPRNAPRSPNKFRPNLKQIANCSWPELIFACWTTFNPGTPAGNCVVRQGGVIAVENDAQTGPAPMAMKAPEIRDLRRVVCSWASSRSSAGLCLVSKVRHQVRASLTIALATPREPETNQAHQALHSKPRPKIQRCLRKQTVHEENAPANLGPRRKFETGSVHCNRFRACRIPITASDRTALAWTQVKQCHRRGGHALTKKSWAQNRRKIRRRQLQQESSERKNLQRWAGTQLWQHGLVGLVGISEVKRSVRPKPQIRLADLTCAKCWDRKCSEIRQISGNFHRTSLLTNWEQN